MEEIFRKKSSACTNKNSRNTESQMKSLACGMLLAAFLLMSTPSVPISYAGPAARIVYVMDLPAPTRRPRRRNHYTGREM